MTFGHDGSLLLMNLILHAGMHKTGTTTFQRYLEHYKCTNNEVIWVLPNQFNVRNPKKFNPSWIYNCLDSNDHINKTIVSHEGLSTFNAKEWKLLCNSFPSRINIKVILVFRHWKSYLASRWSTYCLRRDAFSFHEFLKRVVVDNSSRVDMNHSLCITNAQEGGITNFSCIDYDAIMNQERSILPILCRETGIKYIEADSLTKNFNMRANLNVIDFIRILNEARSIKENRSRNDLFDSFAEKRPVDIFYDHSKILSHFKLHHRGIIDELMDSINQSIKPIEKKKDLNSIISKEYYKRRQLIQPWLKGPSLDILDESDHSPMGMYSTLRYEDLDLRIQEEIQKNLNILDCYL